MHIRKKTFVATAARMLDGCYTLWQKCSHWVSAIKRNARRKPKKKGAKRMWVVDLIIEKQRSIEREKANRQSKTWYLDIERLLKNERRRRTRERK